MNHPLHTHESKNNPRLPQVSTEILAGQIQGVKNLVNGALKKMREQEKILLEKKKKQEEMLLEKKRRTEEIILVCEKSENEEIIPFAEILREAGDINAVDDRGYTLLMTIAYNHYKGIKLLLSYPNILINQKNSAGYTALMYASNFGNIGGIQSLLAQSNILVNEKEKVFGFTALIMASQHGAQATRAVLTHPEVLVNEEDKNGKTALVFAAILGNIKTVKLLLKDHRMNLKENNQGEKALKETSHTKIKTLIEAKMREQGIEF